MGHHRHHRGHRHHEQRHRRHHHVFSSFDRGLKKAFKSVDDKVVRPIYQNIVKPAAKDAISLGKNTLDREQRLFDLASNPVVVIAVCGIAAIILLRK